MIEGLGTRLVISACMSILSLPVSPRNEFIPQSVPCFAIDSLITVYIIYEFKVGRSLAGADGQKLASNIVKSIARVGAIPTLDTIIYNHERAHLVSSHLPYPSLTLPLSANGVTL